MEETINFDTSVDTELDGDIDSGDLSITLADSTGLPSTGTIIIDDDIITYTANAANVLTVTGVGSAHEGGSQVRRIYSMTNLGISDFDKPIYLSLNESEIQYYDGRGGLDLDRYEIDNDDFLHLPFNSEARRAAFKYKKLVTTLSADSDTFLIPDDYITMVVEFALYKAKSDLGYAATDIEGNFVEFMRLKRLMKNDYAVQTENKNRRIKTIYQPDYVRT